MQVNDILDDVKTRVADLLGSVDGLLVLFDYDNVNTRLIQVVS